MPLYEFQCDKCYLVFEEFSGVEAINKVHCPKCKNKAHRCFITPPQTYREVLPYFDNGLGTRVESRDDRRRKMAAKGLVEADESLAKDAKQYLEEHRDNEADKRHRN